MRPSRVQVSYLGRVISNLRVRVELNLYTLALSRINPQPGDLHQRIVFPGDSLQVRQREALWLLAREISRRQAQHQQHNQGYCFSRSQFRSSLEKTNKTQTHNLYRL